MEGFRKQQMLPQLSENISIPITYSFLYLCWNGLEENSFNKFFYLEVNPVWIEPLYESLMFFLIIFLCNGLFLTLEFLLIYTNSEYTFFRIQHHVAFKTIHILVQDWYKLKFQSLKLEKTVTKHVLGISCSSKFPYWAWKNIINFQVIIVFYYEREESRYIKI